MQPSYGSKQLVSLTSTGQKVLYLACDECNKNKLEQLGSTFFCKWCNSAICTSASRFVATHHMITLLLYKMFLNFVFHYRFILQVDASDGSETITLILFGTHVKISNLSTSQRGSLNEWPDTSLTSIYIPTSFSEQLLYNNALIVN